MKKAHAQALLQAGDALAYGGGGDPEMAPSRHEATALRRLHEDGIAVQTLHGGPSIKDINVRITKNYSFFSPRYRPA
jgi:hypothetical protein